MLKFKVIEELPEYQISNLGNIKNRKGELMWDVVYRNDFANGNVAGYLSDEEVLELLEWIKSLEK